MACLDMYNQNSSAMSPRISFSNDFVDSTTISHSSQLHQMMKKESSRSYRDAPVSSDFEFNVSNYSMMSADELFFKGRLLPFKESVHSQKTTLRDELLNGDEDDAFSLRPPKSCTRWKGFLGLKKSHIASKKIDNNNQGSVEKRSNVVGSEELFLGNKNSQEPYNGGSSCRDVEFRFN
ncbi:uncharacterized protein [Nicotiana tomentosiformis]|uniref:uncharacterized protein n=1 Tax=Nicotiana tomentosiformis TaxID=4098 RepID=UPI00051C9F99|nr:uncharacterized protein LOC104087407 [Nicotiana tomentosiformis]